MKQTKELKEKIFETMKILKAKKIETPSPKICPKTLFLGISVLLENVLDFKEGLSENAKKSAQKAFERILEIDKNLN